MFLILPYLYYNYTSEYVINNLHSPIPVEGSCENGNEPTGSIKCWEVPE
jgi:hypothetical protein